MKKDFLILVTVMALSICSYGQELRPVKGLKNKWGFVDGTGKEVIPFKYVVAQEFSEGLAAVKKHSGWGFIDTTGYAVIRYKYQSVGKFSEGMVRVSSDYFDSYDGLMRYSKWKFIDKNGLVVIPEIYDDAGDFSEGLARVKSKKKWGFINNTGTPVISFIYDDASDFSEGTARVKIKRDWVHIDKTGKEVFKNVSTENQVTLEREKAEPQKQERTEQEVINTVTTGTYDVILLKDGQEIKAKVTEITPSEIKYKAFENLNGPTRTLAKSDVFRISHADGTQELISAATKNRNKNTDDCTVKTAFGMDIGFGGSFDALDGKKSSDTWSATAFGMRVTHHFNPYFGIDFFKMNWITEIGPSKSHNPWIMRFQLMPGIRGNSPTFFKCMSVYTVFRLGYGISFSQSKSSFEDLCLETELGLNLTRNVFAGFSYNYSKYFNKGKAYDDATHILSFRIGFNFGKK